MAPVCQRSKAEGVPLGIAVPLLDGLSCSPVRLLHPPVRIIDEAVAELPFSDEILLDLATAPVIRLAKI